MSGGFSFPPPPPPPPKAAPDWDDGQSFQSGQRGRGGRGRGRGRGSQDGRGRGRGNHSGNDNPNYGSHLSAASGPSSYTGSTGMPRMNGGFQPLPNFMPNLSHNSPPGSFVNPNFRHQQSNQAPNSNGYGQQNGSSHQRLGSSSGYPERTAAGHKRKLDALRGPPQEKPKPRLPAPPPVPSFGAPIIPPAMASRNISQAHNLKADSSNRFGLTPGEGDRHYSSSDAEEEEEEIEKEMDEEAMFADFGNKLTFEHNGVVMALNTAADVVAWQQERKKNWPTKARMAERDAEKRLVGAERRRHLAVAALLKNPAAGHTERKRKVDGKAAECAAEKMEAEQKSIAAVEKTPETELQLTRHHLTEQTIKLDALRKQVEKSQARLDKDKAKQQADEEHLAASLAKSTAFNSGDPNLKAENGDDVSDGDESLSESSALSSDDEDDEDAPEESTSKQTKPDISAPSRPICRYFTASGRCRDGGTCAYRHESRPPRPQQHQHALRPKPAPAPRDQTASSHRKSIYQRLVEQEQEEEDRLMLQVVKHLGKSGFFD